MRRFGISLVVSVVLASLVPLNAASASTGWAIVPSPNKILRHGSLSAISCAGATACEAIGSSTNRSGANVAIGEGWTGTAWNVQSIRGPVGAVFMGLSAISCPTATQCTAVGSYSNGSSSLTLAEAFNGTSWSVQHTPNPVGAMSSNLSGISCPTVTQCTAVGNYFTGSATLTLAEAWNGTNWKIQATPNPAGATSSMLNAVSCAAITACTAFGVDSTFSGSLTLAETWDGSQWSIQSTADPSGSVSNVSGVSCAATNACMAVGTYFDGSANVPLAEAWDGTTWTLQPVPIPSGAVGTFLLGVSCAAATQCVTVGDYFTGPSNQTLAEAWNGTGWTVESTPAPPGAQSALAGISCRTATLCIAAGSSFTTLDRTLAEAWNGTTWRLLHPVDVAGAATTTLTGVACSASTACVAVGFWGFARGSNAPLAEVWNGTSWSIKSTPIPNHAQFSGLTAVACSSASACTGVGSYSSGNSGLAFAESWNGITWALQHIPNRSGTTFSNLTGIACPAATACTAVGAYSKGTGNLSLAEGWNGTAWKIQTTPNPTGATSINLSAVSCSAANACTAVGGYFDGSSNLTLAEAWNGTKWSVQPTPNPSGSTSSNLTGVSCAAANQCTAVGVFQNGFSNSALVEAWDGTSWTIQTTPTPAGASSSSLGSVSCPGTAQCTAVGGYATLTSSFTLAEAWDGTGWSIQTTPNPSTSSNLAGVSCPTATACAAVGNYYSNFVGKTLAEAWSG
jgi:hypothetical protein